MASRSKNLLTAEYNGKKFYWISETETGGRNLVVYKFPNSNAQTIQDLGGIPQTFTVKAVIAGSNYLADSEAFRNALIQGGEGDLIIPNFGIHKVRLQDYTRETSQNIIGRHEYSLTFLLKEMTGLTGVTYATSEDIYNDYLEANEALGDSLEKNWKPPSTNSNRLSAVSDAKAFAESAREVVKGINSAVRQAEKLVNEVDSAISEAETYAELLVKEGVFATLASAVGLGSSYEKIKTMIDFGKNLPDRLYNLGETVIEAFSNQIGDTESFLIPFWDDFTTIEWAERNNNRRAMVESCRGSAYIALMNDVPNLELQTAEQLQAIKSELQGYFFNLANDSESLIFADAGFMEKLLILKETVFRYLDQLEEEVFYQAQITASDMPANVLSCLLYGEENRDEIIRRAGILKELNDGKVIFDGITEVLEVKQ